MPTTKRPTPRRTAVRVGPGEFRDPTLPAPKAQQLFVDAVARLVPDALVELAKLADQTPDEQGGARLKTWARARGFSDGWLLRLARRSIALWREHPGLRGELFVVAVQRAPRPVAPENPTWDPREETEASFRSRVDDYIHAVSGAEYARGAEVVKTKRTRPGEPVERHFEWLALRVVGGLTLDEISRRYPAAADDAALTPSAILRGIRAAATLAGVTVTRS